MSAQQTKTLPVAALPRPARRASAAIATALPSEPAASVQRTPACESGPSHWDKVLVAMEER